MSTVVQNTVTLDLSRQPQLPEDHLTIAARASALQVHSEADYGLAAELIQRSITQVAKVEEFFEGTPQKPGMKRLAHQAHASICETIRTLTAPWRSVRTTLEPRMKAFRAEQERARRAAEAAAKAEADRKLQEAQEAARRLEEQAAAEAARARQAGDMRAARQIEAEAAGQAQAVVEEAAAIAEVALIAPDTRPADRPGEARPWIGEVTDMKLLCRAIGEGKIPLEYEYRGNVIPLVIVDAALLTHLAKRAGQEDIGIPGARGKQDIQLRFSSGAAKPKTDEEW